MRREQKGYSMKTAPSGAPSKSEGCLKPGRRPGAKALDCD